MREFAAKRREDPTAQLALAMFLLKWKSHNGEGLDILRRLADKHPDDYPLLDAYATQLRNVEGCRPESERIYKKIVAEAPDQTNTLGNYAQLLFWEGRIDEGRVLLERALASVRSSIAEPSALVTELSFYQYAHVAEARSDALKKLKILLLLGAVSPDWNLDPNVVRATQDGHPQPKLLRLIADAIVGRLDIPTLQQNMEWKGIDA